MQVALAFIDSVAIEEVSLSLWRETFDAIGWPDTLAGQRESFTHEDILIAFQRDTLNSELLQALETVHDLGTPEGREAIGAVMTDRHIPSDTLPAGLGEREFALRLFLDQRTNSALAEVFSRAQIQVHEGNHRRFNDFMGKGPKPIRDLPATRQALRDTILEHCRQTDLGEYVEVKVFDDEDGTWLIQIMRSHHTRTTLAVVPGSTAPMKLQYRPIHADLARYDSSVGRLRITARAATIVRFYQQAFGRALFNDEEFFGGDPVCSLRVLQERKRAALADHRVPGVGRVWMTECVWERGDRQRLSIHDDDCFDAIDTLKLPLHEGELLQAKFKMEVTGASRRPVIVSVRVPSRIEVSQSHQEILVNEVLTAIGIRDPQPRPSEWDLWTLTPWRQPTSTWRSCFGADTDSLIKKGVLVTTQLVSIVPPGYAGAGHVLEVERLSPVESFGVSQTPEIPSQSLSATDLDGFELNVSAFQAHLRELLGITSNANPWSDRSWLLDLGVVEVHDFKFRLAYAVRQPPHDGAVAVRALASSLRPILLLPKGLPESTGITEILLDKALPDRHRVVQDIIAASNLTEEVPALLTAPKNAQVVVDTKLGKIWFDKIEITELKHGTQPFRYVEILARNAPRGIDKYALSAQLSPGRANDEQPARSAKYDANTAMKAAFEAHGRTYACPFRSESGRHRLTVLGHVR